MKQLLVLLLALACISATVTDNLHILVDPIPTHIKEKLPTGETDVNAADLPLPLSDEDDEKRPEINPIDQNDEKEERHRNRNEEQEEKRRPKHNHDENAEDHQERRHHNKGEDHEQRKRHDENENREERHRNKHHRPDNKHERKHEGKRDENKERKHHYGKENHQEMRNHEKDHQGNDKRKNNSNNKDDKTVDSGFLRSQNLSQPAPNQSDNQNGHNGKKRYNKIKKSFKSLPKGARIAIIVSLSIIGLLALCKLIRFCKKRRQLRKERREGLRQQQQLMNQSMNFAQPFLNSSHSIAVGQPLPAPDQQQGNYQYPPLTNTIIAQQLQQQQMVQQQQHQNNMINYGVPQVQQPYFAIPNNQNVPVHYQHQHPHQVQQQQRVPHPVVANAQNIMQVELPQLSINQDRSISQQSVEEYDNSRRYPILPQQQHPQQQQQQYPVRYQQF